MRLSTAGDTAVLTKQQPEPPFAHPLHPRPRSTEESRSWPRSYWAWPQEWLWLMDLRAGATWGATSRRDPHYAYTDCLRLLHPCQAP